MDAKTLVWIRSGGRCAICNRYLLDDPLGVAVPVGENAHIVGQKDSERSPRGKNDLAVERRDDADNLVLLCREQHKIIDTKELVSLFTVEQLRGIKHRHEARIRKLTDIAEAAKTCVFRLVGEVRGDAPSLTRAQAASSIIASSGKYPHYPLSVYGDGIEADLSRMANEGSPTYYAAARDIIDAATARLAEAITGGLAEHVSVLAFARLPLLVYAGRAIGDTYPADIYQRHRTTQDWTWREEGPVIDFDHSVARDGDAGPDAVLLVNVSGTIQIDELPPGFDHVRVFEIAPVNATPEADTLVRQESFKKFAATVRSFFASLEKTAKKVNRLHVHAAMPVSAAVELGRAFNADVTPTLCLYEIVGDQRVMTMEIQ